MATVQAIACVGKWLCNCKNLPREVIFDTAYFEMYSFLNICHDDDWERKIFFNSFCDWSYRFN